MSAKQLSNDCDHPSLKDIGKLLLESQELMFSKLGGLLSNVLMESQAKLVESQAKLLESQATVVESQLAKLVEFQENTQRQVSEIFRSISGADNNNSKEKEKDEEEEREKEEEEIVAQNQASEHGFASEQGFFFEDQGFPFKASEQGLFFEDQDFLFEASEQEDDGVAIYINDRTRRKLYNAVTNNDWEKAKEVLEENPEAINRGLTEISSTILHLAIGYNAGMTFVEEIVKRMTPTVLGYRSTEMGDTALHSAVLYHGRTESAKLMVNKNPGLTQIRNKEGMVPLELALHHVTIGQKDIVEYLYSVTRDEYPSPFESNVGARLLCSAIDVNFYDIALSLVERFPDLIMEKSLAHDMCALELMATRPFTFRSGAKLTWWQNCIYSIIQVDPTHNHDDDNECDEENPLENSRCTKAVKGLIGSSCKTVQKIITNLVSMHLMPCLGRVLRIKNLENKKSMHEQATALVKQMVVHISQATTRSETIEFLKDNPNIMKAAIRHGITEFMVGCLEKFPYLADYRLPEQNIIEMAIAERNELMVNLICKSTIKKIDLVSRIDNDGNTILHYAAKLAPPAQLNLVPGVAIQMQRELQWFKGVESIMSENDRFKRNKKGETAQFVFSEEHKKLVKEGEDWMKDTSGSCMIVTALIATVAFAAAFTVPGGNISDSNNTKNGTPVFLGKATFTVFVVADTLALTSSVTSVLMFLAIYTSRYAEIDFLRSLPQKLIIGLATLFISMAAILVAFCASLFIVVGDKFPHSPIALFVCAPAALFAWLQLPLFYEMVRSTYWGNVLVNHVYIDPRLEKNNNNKNKSIISRVKKLITSFWR